VVDEADFHFGLKDAGFDARAEFAELFDIFLIELQAFLRYGAEFEPAPPAC